MGTKIPSHSVLVHELLAIEIEFIAETDNCIGFEFQYQINHGPERNVEFSIPIQTPYRQFFNV